ncbi:Maf family protein [Acidocella aquatica]|nr:nucleoside triphosphate pyrophosphatase [Acidocella aquatica]
MDTSMRLILASGSPARQAMLRQAGLICRAVKPDVDESAVKRGFVGEVPALALTLAAAKAMRVAQDEPGALVIGADQVLVCEGEIFAKPGDMADAAAQLRRLRGRTHTLVTAVCVCQGAGMVWSDVAQARLSMRAISDEFIAGYLRAEGEAVLGCVGVYRLEGLGAQLFSAIEGDFFTILGLNLLPLLGFLREAGAIRA